MAWRGEFFVFAPKKRKQAEIWGDVERLLGELCADRNSRDGRFARATLLAMNLAHFGHEVDQRCPACGAVLEVIPYKHGCGCTVRCPCGKCKSEFKGL